MGLEVLDKYRDSIGHVNTDLLSEDYWKRDMELHAEIAKEAVELAKSIEMSHEIFVRKFTI